MDIGSGSGYLTVCMSELVGAAGKVIGIEHIKELADVANRNVSKNKQEYLDQDRIKFIVGDGRLGYPAEGPYDCMLVIFLSTNLIAISNTHLSPIAMLVLRRVRCLKL